MKLCENLSIGVETWLCINALEEEMDTKPFFVCVKAFYSATLQKFFKKFPFGDTILQDFLHRNSQIFFFLLKTFLLLGITKIVMEWRNHVLGFFGGKLVR